MSIFNLRRQLPFFLVLWSLVLFGREAHAQEYCAGSYDTVPDTIYALRPPLNGSCQREAPVYENYIRHKENYIPYPGTTTARTVAKKVRVRFMVGNPMTPTKQNFDAGDTAMFNTMIHYLNDMFANNQAPTKPQTDICGSCHIPDTRIRFELQGVSIFNDQVNYAPPKSSASPNLSGEVEQGDSVLNIFLLRYSASDYEGVAKGGMKYYFSNEPNKHYIIMVNMYQSFLAGKDWESIRTIMHELYHLWGLGHVTGQPNYPESCDESNIDYLLDIFNTGVKKVCNQTGTFDDCDVALPNYPYYTCDNNVMAVRGRTWTSPMQAGIIHRSSHLGSMARYMYPAQDPSDHPWVISADQTWDFPIRMFQDIIVKKGATLTIQCEVQMPPGGRIRVEKGGKLIVDKGLITSYHPKTRWNGIEAYGDKGKGPSTDYQGYVELKNGAMIENAQGAVRNFSWDNGAQGGGIIKATDAYFYNCWRGLELNDYPNYATSINIERCTFLLDDLRAKHINSTPFETQVTSWNVLRGINIKNCLFKVDIPDSLYKHEKRNGAILSSQSGMGIQSNTFDGFRKGVDAYSYAGTAGRTMSVYHNTFKNNTWSIAVRNNAYTDIRDNKIEKMYRFKSNIDNSEYEGYGVGVMLYNTQGAYVGCGNQIDCTPQRADSANDRPNLGVVAHSTNDFGATILDNKIKKGQAGVQTQRGNPRLNITCNAIDSNEVAIMANPQSKGLLYSLNDQGTGCGTNELRAGNTFNKNQREIVSYVAHHWDYYAYTTALDNSQLPAYTSGNMTSNNCLSLINSPDANSQCFKGKNCVYPFEFESVSGLKSTLKALSLAGQRYAPEGQTVIGSILHYYNEHDDTPGLIAFLEDEAEDNARRLLIPLYVEVGRYTDVPPTIAAIDISSTEQGAYTDYYGVLKALRQDDRRPDQMTVLEKATVEGIAAEEYEVSNMARGLLYQAYGTAWGSYIEQEEPEPSARPSAHVRRDAEGRSKLLGAAPNPSDGFSVIRAYVCQGDADKAPALVIRDAMGKTVRRYALKAGESATKAGTADLLPGLYIYELEVGGKTVEAQKLSVLR